MMRIPLWETLAISERFNSNHKDIRHSRKAKPLDNDGETEYNELYTSTDEFVQKMAPHDREMFARSLANKTADIKNGESRTLSILGSTRNKLTRVYYFVADGYMHGAVIDIRIVKDQENNERRKRKNGTYSNTGIADLWNDSILFNGRESDGNIFLDGYGREANADDNVSEEPPEGYRAGDYERSWENYQDDIRKVNEIIRRLREMYGLPDNDSNGSDLNIKRSGKPEKQEGGVPRPILNRTRFKTYTHEDAERVISSILLNKLHFNDGSRGEIKNRGELADKLYMALNTAEKGKRAGVALDIAEYIIQHTAMKGIYDDSENAEYLDTVSLLKPYLHSFNLSSISEEMKHRYGKKKASGIRLLWDVPKGGGFTPDEAKSGTEVVIVL